jgi:hypothetical protein
MPNCQLTDSGTTFSFDVWDECTIIGSRAARLQVGNYKDYGVIEVSYLGWGEGYYGGFQVYWNNGEPVPVGVYRITCMGGAWGRVGGYYGMSGPGKWWFGYNDQYYYGANLVSIGVQSDGSQIGFERGSAPFNTGYDQVTIEAAEAANIGASYIMDYTNVYAHYVYPRIIGLGFYAPWGNEFWQSFFQEWAPDYWNGLQGAPIKYRLERLS